MPGRGRAPLDPRVRLVRLVERLSERHQYVTVEDIRARAARPSSRLAVEDLTALVDAAVGESLLLKDLRTFFDRHTGAFTDRWVYRVNPRHPLLAESDEV